MSAKDWASQVVEMERRIECLEDVRASRIVPTPGRRDIEEIHVVACRRRRPKQIVRDVESLLLVDFGCHVDYRKISLVQIGEEDFTIAWARRPRLISVEEVPQPQRAIRVTLMKGNGEEVHASCATEGHESLASASARACLRAVRRALADAPELELEGIGQVSIGERHALFACVIARDASTTQYLLGACFMGRDEPTTASLAVLDSVNRRFFAG